MQSGHRITIKYVKAEPFGGINEAEQCIYMPAVRRGHRNRRPLEITLNCRACALATSMFRSLGNVLYTKLNICCDLPRSKRATLPSCLGIHAGRVATFYEIGTNGGLF